MPAEGVPAAAQSPDTPKAAKARNPQPKKK